MKFNFLKSKQFLVLCIGLGLAGCSSFSVYFSTFNDAIKSHTNTVVIKQEGYQELKPKIEGYFQARGYSDIIYADEKKGFYVYNKQGTFDEPCQIILKFSLNPKDNKMRIDLVKGSDDIITDGQVGEDIRVIADQIKND